jgi:hypothetical protein
MADKRYLELLDEMKQLHIRKNAGYAGKDNPDAWANFRMSEAFGVSAFLGCLVRMSDKYIRITNLLKDPSNEMVGESVDDTLFDLAAYALIAVCLRQEQEEKAKNENVLHE